ncbi:MAG: biotin transporter BioY [Bacteriovoracaceae bacterium]|nr:biotin transporter BioY [Bacteriovoracaceae bacterium]
MNSILKQNNNILTILLPDEYSGVKSDVLVALLGSLALALMAQIRLPLSFTPVPITAQSMAILIIGSSFGAKRAFLATLFYLIEGVAGLPFFSGGKFGMAVLLGPTGGYLIGFILASTTMGYLSDKMHDRSYKTSFPLFALGHLLIFLPGCLWLGKFVGVENILTKGFYPFIPGLLIKTIIAGSITPSLWKFFHLDQRRQVDP